MATKICLMSCVHLIKYCNQLKLDRYKLFIEICLISPSSFNVAMCVVLQQMSVLLLSQDSKFSGFIVVQLPIYEGSLQAKKKKKTYLCLVFTEDLNIGRYISF